MIELGALPLGVTLFLAGLAFFILTTILLRVIPQYISFSKGSSLAPVVPELPQHDNAVIVIQPGGRVSFMNQEARSKFKVWNDEPNLERLARRTRPGDVFLGLCATEGQARFALDGQMMEATSYIVPNGSGNSILLSIRPDQLKAQAADGNQHSNHTLEILTAVSQSVAANLELEDTLHSILTSLDQLVPNDFAEITIWDPDEGQLIPYRYLSVPGSERRVEGTEERYPLGGGYSGYVAEKREPVLVADVDSYREIRPLIDRGKFPFHSYVGYPLVMGGELIGTLDLTSLDKDAFSENDVEILKLFAGQAAIALHNALLYRDEKRRALELSSLANLTQAVSSIRNSKELFARLAQGISPLLDVNIAGFLVYDDAHRKLIAQNPFIGVPPHFVDLYQLEIASDSPADIIWRAQETLIAFNAGEDPQLIDMGLDHHCRAAGIKTTVLLPLKIGGRSLGYLQAANKRDDTPFTHDDVRLLSIIAGQAAPIIENADLVQQSIQRALRAEALRRIATLSASEADLDEILKYSVLELARLLKADAAAIFFLDESIGELQVHLESIYGVEPELHEKLGRIPIEEGYAKFVVSNSQQPFISDNAREDQRVLPPYRLLIDTLEVLSVVDVPLIFRGRGVGEVMLASNRQEHFNRSDIQLVRTVAGQLAIAIERSSLASQTDEDLRQRVEQLTALTRVGRELNASLNLKRLLRRVFEEALNTTRADCGTILLFENDGSNKVRLHIGDEPGTGLHPLERVALEKDIPVLVEDFDNPPGNLDESTLRPAHANVNSALVVPIAYRGAVVGLLHLHSEQPGRFDEAALQIAQALSVQAAIAIGNVQRYQEQVRENRNLSKRVHSLSGILEATETAYSDQPLDQPLRDIASGIRESTTYSEVSIGICEERDTLRWVSTSGVSAEKLASLREIPLSWADIENTLLSDYLLVSSYFIRQDQTLLVADWQSALVQTDEEGAPLDAILLLPIYKTAAEPLGLIAVASQFDGEYPDRVTLEILDGFAQQTRLIIDHHKWVGQLELQIEELETQVNVSRQSIPPVSDQIAQAQSDKRVHIILEIIENLARQPDRFAVLQSLGASLIAGMEFDSAIVVEMGEGRPQLIHVLGDISQKINLEALLGQRNPLQSSLKEGQIHLVSNVAEDEQWGSSPLIEALQGKGFLCLPVLAQAGSPAAILAVSSSTKAQFFADDEKLFGLLAAQTATTLNNLTLLTETGQRLREGYLLLEFSRQLGGLESERIIRLLTESVLGVVQSAHASLTAIWEPGLAVLQPKAAMGYSDNASMLEMEFFSGDNFISQAFEQGKTICVDQVDFNQHYNLSADSLLRYHQATDGRLPVSSMVVPIQSGKSIVGIVLLDNFHDVGAFSIDDQALVGSFSRQAALTLENIELYEAAEERAEQLASLSTVSAEISTTLELDALVTSLLERMEDLVPFDTATLWLLEGSELAIRSVRGFDNSADLIGLKTTVADSRLFNEMITTRQPISVADIRQDDRFADLPTERYSWLAIPMVTKGEVVGVIVIEKTEAGYFDPEHGQILITFANQTAVAMENAELYRQSVERSMELDHRSQRLAQINRFSNEIGSTLDIERLLDVTTQEIADVLSCTQVSAILHDDTRFTLMVEQPDRGSELPKPIPDAPIFERLNLSLGVFSTRNVAQEDELSPLLEYLDETDTEALLVLPLVTGVDVHGYIFAQSNQPRRFSPDEVELSRIIINQASVALQNAALFTQTRQLTEELEERVQERTEQLAQEHQRAQALLRIMRELSASLDLDHVLNRTLKLVNDISESEQGTILLIKPGEETFYYRASLGYTDPPPLGGRSTELNTGEGLAGWIVQHREAVLIEDLHNDERWVQEGEQISTHRSAVGVPLLVGAELLGVMLLFHQNVAHFRFDQVEMVQAAANQIAVSINNAELFNLIREQAERLGTMLRTQQIETSRSRSILEAVADGVLVTDSDSRITLFNDSAQTILGLQRGDVVGKSLDDFSGLFGGAAQTWMSTIAKWSSTPASYETGGTFAEQIILDDGRFVAIHLAPVQMQEEFLGTVTIFRDITHQVEIDRLKSEFVATVSHELRTPMTSIKGYVEVLLMGAAGDLSDQQSQFLDVVLSNTERLNVLVNDLLDVSRIDAGKYELSMQPLRLQDLTQEVVSEQQRQAGEDNKPISIEYELPSDLPRVRGDEQRVRQILSNLVRNAYHYTPANGNVNIRAVSIDDEVQVDVKDDGIGIETEVQDRVFERFYRGEDPLVLATAGTGLGLSIVQQLIELHDGRIWVQSDGIPGNGSTFSFTLPIFKDD